MYIQQSINGSFTASSAGIPSDAVITHIGIEHLDSLSYKNSNWNYIQPVPSATVTAGGANPHNEGWYTLNRESSNCENWKYERTNDTVTNSNHTYFYVPSPALEGKTVSFAIGSIGNFYINENDIFELNDLIISADGFAITSSQTDDGNTIINIGYEINE